MTSLTFATLLQAALTATDADNYADAHRQAENGKPMVVLVGAPWCAPCQQMKKTVIPQIRNRGLLQKVAFAFVNADRDRQLARKLTGGGAIPQLVMFRKTSNGWKRRKLVGGQSVDTVEEFINQGVAMNEEAEKPGAKEEQGPPPKKENAAREPAQKAKALPVSAK